jgi:NAD(P)-dependent dehydrogenase (short-subunit alcohol dehydrogenase family)
MNKLKNKNIVVTGGNGLLGNEFISFLNKEAATVINLEKNIVGDKHNINCDITDESSVKDVIKFITKNFGNIDGWVNNAYPRTEDWGNKFEDIKYESWKKNVDLQLGSVFLCCKLVLEHMKKNNYGSIVNIASIYGVIGPEFSIYEGTSLTTPAAYSAIKGGVINFSRYLASYYGKYGLRINCVSPGGIYNNQNKKFVNNYIKNVPLKRMGKPSDISPAVSFLLSEDSSYITGQNLIVDGGWTCK